MTSNLTKLPQPLIPPLRFSIIYPRIYRGSYPRKINYRFLLRYEIKFIISLTPFPITIESDENLFNFCQENDIELLHFEVGKGGKGKKRQVPLTKEIVNKVLIKILDILSDENKIGNIYIHCLNGGHVTSLIVACLRHLMDWTNASIFSEFIKYSDTINITDRQFVENFKEDEIVKNHNYWDLIKN